MTPPILFLHGWTMRGAVFDNLIARLGPDFECAAPDLPGHSTAADQSATLAACADTVSRCLAQWPGRRALVVGWSMGAAAIWSYIACFGTRRLAGLVTIDMSPKIVPTPDWPYGLKGQTAESVAATADLMVEDWEAAASGIAATMFATREGAPSLSRAAAMHMILANDPAKMRALWVDLLAMDARAVIPQIDVPYLVCSGARSRVYDAAASEWIVHNAPDARWQQFGASGHSPHLEEPEALAQILTRFAEEIAI